jgi:hypothetical protein
METDMSNYGKEELKAANQRADRERRTRLTLIDAVTECINKPYDTVEALKAAVEKTLEGNR